MFHIASDEKLQGGPGDEAREIGVLIYLVGASKAQDNTMVLVQECPAKSPGRALF